MSWTAETNLPVAHALHRVAWRGLDDRLGRYVDADKRLRKAAGKTPPEPPDSGRATASDALAASERVRWDAEWFDVRWNGGEREAMEAAAQRIVEEARLIPDGGLVSEGWAVIASPTLAGLSAACPRSKRVGVGPRSEALLAVLTAVGVELGLAMPLHDLNRQERRYLCLQVAASAILEATGDEEALSPWLAHALTFLSPVPSGREAHNAMIRGMAARLLDQPPGEIERISEGLCRAQAPRLHRAWRRGFFVPRDFDLAGWVKTRRG